MTVHVGGTGLFQHVRTRDKPPEIIKTSQSNVKEHSIVYAVNLLRNGSFNVNATDMDF